MTEQIKQRIEMINRGEVPEGYKKTKVGIVPQEWRTVSANDCMVEYRKLSNDIINFSVYSSSRKGLILQSEYYDKREAEETNLGYKVVPKGFVTYRHMSDDDIFHFNINYTGKDILVSSEYPVFNTASNSTLEFIIPLFNESPRFRYFCRTQKLGGTRTRLYMKNLYNFNFALPPIHEQEKIAEILTTQDKLIELKQKLINEKKQQKKWLMQQLLTGKIRLKGFSGEWKKVRLGEVCEIVKGQQLNKDTLSENGDFYVLNGGITPSGYTNEWNVKENTISISEGGNSCGFVNFNLQKFWSGGHCYIINTRNRQVAKNRLEVAK